MHLQSKLPHPVRSIHTRPLARVSALVLLVGLSACGGGGGPDGGGTPHVLGARALQFDGVNDRVTIAEPSPSYYAFHAVGMTFEAWIRPDELISTPDFAGIVFSKTHWLGLDNNGGGSDQSVLGMVVSVPSTNNAASPLGTLEPGVWQHVAGTFDGTTIRVYLNGSLVGQKTHPGNANSSNEVVMRPATAA